MGACHNKGSRTYIAKGRSKAQTNKNEKLIDDIFGQNNIDVEKIRNAKRESLIVFGENGEIIHNEKGTSQHVGVKEIDYENTIAVHNHPQGKVYPYPSDGDFETFEKSGAKAMVVVSPEYTILVRKDPNYKGAVRTGIKSNLHYTTNNIAMEQLKKKRRNGEISQKEYRTKVIQYNLEAQKKAAKLGGYEMIIKKIN